MFLQLPKPSQMEDRALSSGFPLRDGKLPGCAGHSAEGAQTRGQSSVSERWTAGIWQLPDSEALVNADVWKGWKMRGTFRTAVLDQFHKPRVDKSFPWVLQGCP